MGQPSKWMGERVRTWSDYSPGEFNKQPNRIIVQFPCVDSCSTMEMGSVRRLDYENIFSFDSQNENAERRWRRVNNGLMWVESRMTWSRNFSFEWKRVESLSVKWNDASERFGVFVRGISLSCQITSCLSRHSHCRRRKAEQHTSEPKTELKSDECERAKKGMTNESLFVKLKAHFC